MRNELAGRRGLEDVVLRRRRAPVRLTAAQLRASLGARVDLGLSSEAAGLHVLPRLRPSLLLTAG